MTLKPLEIGVPITELPTYVEKKSKQMDLNDTPEPMTSLPYLLPKKPLLKHWTSFMYPCSHDFS